MAKAAEIIYDVREALREFVDDSEISNRHILYQYGIKRAKYLRQDLNNYQKTVDNSIQQTLCMALEEVPMAECSVQYSCGTMLRTVKPVPTPLELSTKTAITKVKPVDRIAIPFNFIPKDRAPYIENAPFGRSIYAFLDVDNHVYIYSKDDSYKLLSCITVTGIFEDPLDLEKYFNCCDCDNPVVCFDLATSEYPLQPHYIDVIRDEIVRSYVGTKQIPEDKENDSDN